MMRSSGAFARCSERLRWRKMLVSSNQQRVVNRIALAALLNERLRTRTVAEWMQPLAENGIPAGPINSIEQVFADPQVKHRKLKVELPRKGMGKVPGVACPIRLSASPLQYERAPPALGDSTRELLRERLQMSESAIDELERRGVVA